MSTKNSFLGTGWSFPPVFDKDFGTVVTTSDEVNVEKCLRILISTGIGERVMFPGLGSNLNAFLFEQINQDLLTWIKDLITKAVIDHEPRVDLDDVTVIPDQRELGKLDITLAYTVRTTNTRTNLVYPFYLNEATDQAGGLNALNSLDSPPSLDEVSRRGD